MIQQSLQGRPLSQGFPISSPKSPSTPFINVMFPLWVVPCSLWLRINHNSYGESPQCYLKRYHKWGKRKKKKNLTFYQNIKLLAIVCKDLGTRPTWPPKNSRGQILHSQNSLSGLSLALWSGNKERIFWLTFKLLRNFWGIAITYH